MIDIFKDIYRRNRTKLILITFITVVTSILGIVIPYLNGKFIDSLIDLKNINEILTMVFTIIFLGAINIIFNYIYQVISSKLVISSIYSLRIYILKHLRKIPILKYKEFDPVYLNERTRKDISEVVNVVISNYTNVFIKAIIFITCLIIVGHLNFGTLVCILLIIPVYLVVYKYFRKHIYKLSFEVKESENVFFQIYNEQLYLMEEIKIDSLYDNQDDYVNKKFNYYFKSFSKYIALSTKFNTVESIISLIFQAVLFIFGAISILNKNMSIGDLTIINSYFAMIIGIINYYVSLGKVYQESKVSFDRLKKLMNIKEEDYGDIKLKEINKIDINLKFGYKDKQDIINGKEATFKKGYIYSIIGRNGSGKTTLAKLIIGLYKSSDESSTILYNEESLDCIDQEYLRSKNISFVTQKHKMTNKKVSEIFQEIDKNINISNINTKLSYIKNEEIIIEISNIVKRFWNEMYYELSEGEKQMISIFRILCKKSEVLILDEPTSNLDYSKKELLKSILNEVKEIMIVIIISHDNEIMNFSDFIFDMNLR